MAILDLSRAPEPWSIEAGQGERQTMLRLGRRWICLDDIVATEAASVVEYNVEGHMLAVGMFLGAGSLIVLAVALLLLHPRFLAGGMLFVGIGLMLISDIRQGHGMTLHRLILHLADGRREVFASADVAEVAALEAALAD